MKRTLAILAWTSVSFMTLRPLAARADESTMVLDPFQDIQAPAAMVDRPLTAASPQDVAAPLPASRIATEVEKLGQREVERVSYLDVDFQDVPPESPAMPVCRPEVFGSIALLNLKPTLRGMDYAVTEDGTSLTVGRGDLQALEHETDSGFRALLGYRTATGWGLAARYSTIEFEGEDHVVRPDGTGQLFATRTHPDGNEEADTADAVGDLEYHVFDLEASNRILANSFIEMNIFGGLRWAEINVHSQFDYDGRDFVLGRLRDTMEANGIGLQIGSEGSWKIAGGFALTGRVSAGLMRANFKSHRFETNLDDAVVLVDATNEFAQAMPNAEFSGGVSWTRGPFTIAGAYELINWFNAYDRGMFVDDIHEASFGPFSEDILLDGFSLTTTFSR